MKEINFEIESFNPEDFDIQDFQREVEQKLYRTFDIFDINEANGLTLSPRPPKKVYGQHSFLSQLLFWIRYRKGIPIGTALGVTISFLLAKGTSLTPSTIFTILFASIGTLFLISNVFSIYEARQSKKRRESYQKRRQAEELAKQKVKQLSQIKAEKIIAKPNIKELLCPALRSATTDVFEISKVITPVLAGAAIAGSIPIPLNPLLFAAIAVVIAKSGVHSLCADYK